MWYIRLQELELVFGHWQTQVCPYSGCNEFLRITLNFSRCHVFFKIMFRTHAKNKQPTNNFNILTFLSKIKFCNCGNIKSHLIGKPWNLKEVGSSCRIYSSNLKWAWQGHFFSRSPVSLQTYIILEDVHMIPSFFFSFSASLTLPNWKKCREVMFPSIPEATPELRKSHEVYEN